MSDIQTHQKLQTKEEIKNWLDNELIANYVIKEDLTVNVEGDVNLSWRQLKHIPVQFGNVYGSFYCDHNELTSLEGSPKFVEVDFNCRNNLLTNLLASPEVVRNYNCIENKLISLKGSPKRVNGLFDCSYNDELISLKYGPKKVMNLTALSNPLQIHECVNIKIENKFSHNCNHKYMSKQKTHPIVPIELFKQHYTHQRDLYLEAQIFNEAMQLLKEKNKLEALVKSKNKTNQKIKL